MPFTHARQNMPHLFMMSSFASKATARSFCAKQAFAAWISRSFFSLMTCFSVLFNCSLWAWHRASSCSSFSFRARVTSSFLDTHGAYISSYITETSTLCNRNGRRVKRLLIPFLVTRQNIRHSDSLFDEVILLLLQFVLRPFQLVLKFLYPYADDSENFRGMSNTQQRVRV